MRSVFLFGEINEESSINVIEQLMDFSGKQPVTLFINTNGGSIHDAISIIQVMNILPFKVDTVALGHCYSAGMLILAAGTGKRKAGTLSRMMFHPISAELGYNTHHEAMNIAKEMQVTWRTITEIFTTVSNGLFTAKEMSNFNQDVYLTAYECQDLGLIDSVLSDL